VVIIFAFLDLGKNISFLDSLLGLINAGPWGLFLKAAKNCFILLNGSVALKFVIGQPQSKASLANDAFSAFSEPLP
jgi:hypothetical protein